MMKKLQSTERHAQRIDKIRIFFGMYSREVTLQLIQSVLSTAIIYQVPELSRQFQLCKNQAWATLAKLAKAMLIDSSQILGFVPLAVFELESHSGLTENVSTAFSIKFLSCSLRSLSTSLADKLQLVRIIMSKLNEQEQQTSNSDNEAKVISSLITFFDDIVVQL
jgi:hypothetical protein